MPRSTGNAKARRGSASRSSSGSSLATSDASRPKAVGSRYTWAKVPIESKTASRVSAIISAASPGAVPAQRTQAGQHVRHGVLLGGQQQHLARQPVEQERGYLRRAHPQRPPEVTVAAVVDDVVRAPAGRPRCRTGLPPRPRPGTRRPAWCGDPGSRRAGARWPRPSPTRAPCPWPGVRAGAPGRRAGPAGWSPCGPVSRAGGRQGADPGPDERVVGRERVARRRSLPGFGHGQGRLQQPPRLRGFHLR